MAIRVFISHSTSDRPDLEPGERALVQEHSRFRQKFCARLSQEPGIEVVVDDNIPAGSRWREFIFESLGDCNAGIILANEQAISRSPWVDTEAKILGWRAWYEKKDFRLIVVPFGGLKSADIASRTGWEAIALTELQMVPRDGLDHSDQSAVEKAVSQIIATLKELPDFHEHRSSTGWLVARFAGLLDIDTAFLRDLARRVRADITGIITDEALRRRVLRRLYEMGP
jgi:hypothetical protein